VNPLSRIEVFSMKHNISVFKILMAGTVLLGMLFVSPVYCEPAAEPVTAYNGSTLIDPGLVHGTLPNGFQYFIKENSIPEGRVNIHLDVFSGSMDETDEQQGVAHYLEHMLFNGSTHFPPGELIKYFQSIGMDFGADANAHTSFFNTVYDLSLPESSDQYLEKAFVIIEDYAQGALLLESEVERERGVILAEKRQRDSISYRIFKKSFEFELPGSLFNARFPIGTEKVLNAADAKLLRSYYDKWYRPDNMALVVVGDLDAGKVESMILKRFSRLKPRTAASPAKPLAKWKEHSGIKAFYHYEPEAGNSDITIETICWKPFENEIAEDIKRKILNNIANSILQNRLSRMVTSQTANFSKASAYSGQFMHHIAFSGMNASCDPENWKKSLEQISTALQQAVRYGFTEKELVRVKADVITSLERDVKQAQTRQSEHISRKIVADINKKRLLLSEKQRETLLKPYVESITLKDVNEAIKEIWSQDHRLVMVTGNARIQADDPEKVILDVFRKSNRADVKKYRGFESRSFPYLEMPSLTSGIDSRKENINNLDIIKIAFKNNINLNLKKTDFKKNEFIFKVSFGDGKQSEPLNKPGLSMISESVVNNSGLGRIDLDQLDENMAGRDVSMRFGISENSFFLSGSGDPKEAELVFQLMYHYFNDPGFRQEALDLARKEYRQSYENMRLTPEGIMQIRGDAFLADNDPRFGLPHPDVMDKYTLNDIKDWLVPYFQKSFIEVSLAGDFSLEEMVETAEKYIGSFNERERIQVKSTEPQRVGFPAGERLELELESKIQQGIIDIAFLTDDFWNIGQTRRLTVLSRVLSERLRLLIREKLSETYSAYAYNNPSKQFKNYGVMHAVVHVKPERIDFVYNKVKEIISSLSLQDITQEETELALRPLLNHLKIIRKRNSYWLNSVMANSSLYPEKFDWASSMVKDYNAITSDDLNLLAKKYLDTDKSALITVKAAKEKIKKRN